MSARKIRNSWWVDFRFNGSRIRLKSPDDSKAGAQAYEKFLLKRLLQGEEVRPQANEPIPTFADFTQEWFRTYVIPNNKPASQRAKSFYLRLYLIPSFGPLRLNEISKRHLADYVAARIEQGLSPKTINEHLSVVNKCLSSAKDWDIIPNVPSIKRLKVFRPPVDFLSEAEVEQLLSYQTDTIWRDMAQLALQTGLRIGELCALKWEDIDLENRTLTVRRNIVNRIIDTPKNNRIRHIPLTKDSVDMLKGKASISGFVFSRLGGQPIAYPTSVKGLHRLCKEANIRPIGWHTLRHTFASQLVAKGASIHAVQHLLGHSTVTMTERYAHLTSSTLRTAMDLMERKGPASSGVGTPWATHSSIEPVSS